MTITIGYWDIRGVSIMLQIFFHTILLFIMIVIVNICSCVNQFE